MKPTCSCFQDLDDNHITVSASQGHLKCIKSLLAKGCDADEESVNEAIEGGHLKIIQFLESQGCDVDERVCDIAAMSGHLDILKYFISQGYDYDSDTIASAAFGGYIPIIKYLRSLGCDWNYEAILRAGRGGTLKCAKWLIKNGCDIEDKGIFIACAVGGYEFFMYMIQTVKELHKPFVWPSEGLFHLMFRNDPRSIQYALDNGCPFDMKLIYQCLGQIKLSNLKLLLDHPRAIIRPEMRSYIETETLRIAAHYNLEHFKYLINRGFHSYDDRMFKTLETRIIQKDLDDLFWRSFLFEAHSKNRLYISMPLHSMVEMKKRELEEIKKHTSILYNRLPKDVVVYTIQPYF